MRLRDSTHQASAKTAPEKEFEQKFKILLSVTQAQRDFDAWSAELTEPDSSIAVLFVDLDRFKRLNERYTGTIVDQTILPRAQVLIASLVKARGGAYRHEAMVFGEKVRARFEAQEFEIGQAREACDARGAEPSRCPQLPRPA